MCLKPFALAMALLSIVGAAQAQLQARDINQDGAVDAYYDQQQNISWLANASLAGAPGTWNNANSWASQLNLFGVTDWRLPSVFLPSTPAGNGCPLPLCVGFVSLETEITRLYAQVGGDLGAFSNVQSTYWSATYVEPGGQTFSQAFNTVSGRSFGTDELGSPFGNAWAVHDGDVGVVSPVPEPSTYALMLAGLGAVGFMARRRRGAVRG